MWKALKEIQKLRHKIHLLKLKIKCIKHINNPIRDYVSAKIISNKAPQMLGGGGISFWEVPKKDGILFGFFSCL